MAITLCTENQAKYKAGLNYDSTNVSSTLIASYINDAEGFISTESLYDWVTNYASVSAIGKFFLANVTASLAAIYMINYNMSGYTSRTEAQTMLDILWTQVVESLNVLRDQQFRTFILGGVA
jgi:hypothetical protein